MVELVQRNSVSVRLIGTASRAQSWRRPLIAEGLLVPTKGPYTVAFADLRQSDDLDADLGWAKSGAEGLPLVALIGLDDPLPKSPEPSVVVIRQRKALPSVVSRTLRKAALDRAEIDIATVRFRVLSSLGYAYPTSRHETTEAPVALLTEPGPDVVSILKACGERSLVAPLNSSQTLRLLENEHASSLIIHLGDRKEHRVPVLKLIRRQSDLNGLPVAVMAENWDPDSELAWLDAGADLLARPAELPGLLTYLRGAATRDRTRASIRSGLSASSMADDGSPSPLFGRDTFFRLAQEHQNAGHPVAYGILELTPESGSRADAVDEAAVYMTLATPPLEMVTRLHSHVFAVAMPFADEYFARRTMRTLQTLIEDLKFGEEPDPTLIEARWAAFGPGDQSPDQVLEHLHQQLMAQSEPLAIA